MRTVGVFTDGHGRAALAACSGLTCAAESSVHPRVRPPGGPVVPGAGRAGRAGALMAGAAVRESVTLAGRAERARVARAFVDGVLGPGHPCGDVAALLVDELFGNSVRHSGSGAPGETVTVAVRAAGRRCPCRGHRPERARGAGAAPRWPRCGRRSRASARCGPRGAVGVAAARRADGDLVRTAPQLTSARAPKAGDRVRAALPGCPVASGDRGDEVPGRVFPQCVTAEEAGRAW